MPKKEIKKEVEIKEVVEEKVEPTIPDPKQAMINQREEYLALHKRLLDEGIVSIGVLENKIASLNKAIG